MIYVKQQYPIRLYLEVSSEQVCKSHRASHVVPVCSKVMSMMVLLLLLFLVVVVWVMVVVIVMMMMSLENTPHPRLEKTKFKQMESNEK